MKTYSYLALGDSYTIGEQVSLSQSFPYQTVQLLRKEGHNFYAPEIIATTGFTTDELKMAIDETLFLPNYNFVSLLIGVNNQYRGRSVDEFRLHFRVYWNGQSKGRRALTIMLWCLAFPIGAFLPLP